MRIFQVDDTKLDIVLLVQETLPCGCILFNFMLHNLIKDRK